MSSTVLSSPAFSETLAYDPENPSRSSYGNNNDANPYQLRREQVKEQRAAALPSPDLLKEAPVKTAMTQPEEPPKAAPMKINIPNLKAVEEAKSPPTLRVPQSQYAYIPSAPANPPAAKPQPDPERQTVADFKPLPTLQEFTQRSPESLGALAPAAGSDTPPDPTAPLIAMPDASAPPAAAVTPPAPPSAPPAPVAAAPAVAPQAEAAKTPDEAADRSTQVLDNALQEPTPTADNEQTEVTGELPPLEPKAKDTQSTKTKKKVKSKETKLSESKPAKPYSPLDSEPPQGLSEGSTKVIEKLPANIGKPKAKPAGPLNIERSKDLDKVFAAPAEPPVNGAPANTVTHEAMGIKIAMSKPAVNLDYELEKAYDALVAGQPTSAIQIYKNILENDPNNKGALFGLATTYHRSGQLDQARVYYGKLLAIDPNHRDGLNNFLVLLADEAPEEALEQLAKLEARNPDFSPIPAQMAVIYQRLGNTDKATEKMFHAIELAPENLVYRYNLAIMLDKQKKYDEASRLYKQLVQAAMRGENIPGNLQKIQQRLTFIGSNRH